ncbi:MAG TPA: protein kinase, partial [Kofleriaceae bacterium]|nr:protein kinase [Kofleriaceae bacterium]
RHDAEELRARFAREALLTARLEHPSIVSIHEAGRWPTGEPFYAMKLVAGRSLSEIAAERRPLEGRMALLPNLIATVEAVAYAHRQRIIHRDLKPSNVLVGELGETVVIDWGLAKDLAADTSPGAGTTAAAAADPPAPADPAADTAAPADLAAAAAAAAVAATDPAAAAVAETATALPAAAAPAATPASRSRSGRGTASSRSSDLTVEGSVMGTPGYMAPEQAAGADVDERADVYALGAILYHLLGGAEPYTGAGGAEILAAVQAGPPRPLAEVEPGLPQDLCTIVEKAMARAPADRYPTALELAEDLRRFQTGQLVGAHEYSRRELLVRFIARHRHLFVAATAALVATAIILTVSFRRVMRERDRAEVLKRAAARRADDLTLARAAQLVDSDPRKALEVLTELSPDAPPPQWRRAHLVASEARLRGIPTTLTGHDAPVNALALSEAGDLLASADGNAVRLWDLESGRGRELARQPVEIIGVHMSSDGRWVATAGLDGVIRVWSTADGWGTQLGGHEALVYGVEFLPDGRLLSCSADSTIRRWDAATGQQEVIGRHDGAVFLQAVARDGRTAVTSGEDRVIRVWQLADGGRSSRLLRGPDRRLGALAISRDGRLVAAAGGFDEIWLWDLEAGTSRLLRGHEGGAGDLAFSPDGRLLASAGSDHSIRLWDTATGQSEVLRGHQDAVSAVGFDGTGELLTSAGADGTVRVWSVGDQGAGAVQVLGGHGARFPAVMSADGTTLVTASGTTVRRWSIGSIGSALRGHRGTVTAVEFAPSGRVLVSAATDWTIRLWPLGGPDASRPVPRVLPTGAQVTALAVSPAGDRIAALDARHAVTLWPLAGGEPRRLDGAAFGEPVFAPSGTVLAAPSLDHTVRLWDARTGEARILRGHTAWVLAVAFSPDGRWLASAAADRTVRVWRFPDGEVRSLDAQAPVRHVAFAGPGRVVAGELSGAVREWDLATGEMRELAPARAGAVASLVTAPGGDLVAWVDGEGEVQLWSRRAGEHRTLPRGGRAVEHLLFAGGGRMLLGHGAGDHALVWDTATGAGMTLRSYGRVLHDLAVSPDGLFIATAESDRTVRLWPYDLPRSPEPLRAWLRAAAAAR